MDVEHFMYVYSTKSCNNSVFQLQRSLSESGIALGCHFRDSYSTMYLYALAAWKISSNSVHCWSGMLAPLQALIHTTDRLDVKKRRATALDQCTAIVCMYVCMYVRMYVRRCGYGIGVSLLRPLLS